MPRATSAARAALRMATAGGARSMGLADDLRAVQVGRRADLVLLDLNTLGFVPLNDPCGSSSTQRPPPRCAR